MRVSVVSPDLSHNCLGRAYMLAQLLERSHDVEIVGPELQNEIWEPLKDEYNYRGIGASSRIYQFPRAVPNLLELISGDIVYASKPRTTSYGISLLATLGNNRPLILDIDDWESGFKYGKGGLIRTYLKEIPHLIEVNSFYYIRSLESLSGVADARTVSNRFLQDRFGGTLVPHARDTEKFDPSRFDRDRAREELDLPADEFIVMFSGTPRAHKGVDDLARAVADIDQEDIRLVVVGAHDSMYVDEVQQIGGDSIIVRGLQPFDELPTWVATADVIAIPQKDSLKTRGQLPAKVFDAMALGKPIIATDVGDLPIVLKDCGMIIEPGNLKQLRESILKLYNNDELRQTLGNKARQRCVQKYSYDALSPVIDEVVTGVYQGLNGGR